MGGGNHGPRLAALLLAAAALAAPGVLRAEPPAAAPEAAGLDLSSEYRISVLDGLRRTRGYVPADVKAVWSRFLDQVEKARSSVGAPAGPAAPGAVPVPGDLGDGFLGSFGTQRGLGKKLDALAGYRTTLGRASRWIQQLDPRCREALGPGFASLEAEAGAAEGILVRQLGEDIAKGGQGVKFTVGLVERGGLTGSTAQDAFGGLARGLRRELTRLSAGGQIREEQRESTAQELERLKTLLEP